MLWRKLWLECVWRWCGDGFKVAYQSAPPSAIESQHWIDRIRGCACVTYGNGLSELGGVLEATELLEDAGGGAGLDCLQSRSLNAQGGGNDTTRDHVEL